MKIAFPAEQDLGLDSPVYGHFGTARYFIVVDTDTGEPTSIENGDRDHSRGNCKPVAAFGGMAVDAVVVGNIGRGALEKLAQAGIKTYRGIEGTVSENIALAKIGRLPAYPAHQTCASHGDCGHH